ncbi:Asparagine synthetase [glutamine-hydrolyzing] [hydrothermal vent metagenome]|uniref:Asparagine synthetase [glutamine-hydrolyzing] n=1 Tax=hydrothermal vent metagenome TaxID=652676 RepID=A0A3B0YKG8_9ZZZZ
MCGIAGFLYRSKRPNKSELSQNAKAMANRLQHRGPDAGGVWAEAETGVALGHRRLSIIDLSTAGAQPMCSANGRYVIAYNGEIYNWAEPRDRLTGEGYPFAGHSDTEVVLAAIERWGLHKALDSIHGMFAMAIWDREMRELTLVRDRVGKKPLYYGWCGDAFMFASELKALRVHPEFNASIDRDALGHFVQYAWISEPLSIYKNIRKLQPGAYITIKADTAPWSAPVHRYWAADNVMEVARAQVFTGSFEQACDRLDELLTVSVKERMVADVDLGALLSGGIDSSAVVGMMQKYADRPVKTFSIGFDEKKYNEANYASAIARYLGTDHEELYVTPSDCLDVISRLPDIYDEPFGDSSQVPTFLVAQMASRQVKVVLTGDGGDETFAGYKHYAEGLAQWRWLSTLPHGLRVAAADALVALGELSWKLFKPAAPFADKKVSGWRKAGGKLARRTRGWRAEHPQGVLANHFARTHRPESLVIGAQPGISNMADASLWAQHVDPLSAMRHFDYTGYLVGDILVKVDRASMAVGLEARCPILDTRVTEFAWSLPNEFLMAKEGGKRVLRSVLERYVPREFTDRPKRGFGVPIDDWLRGPLRDWAEDLISEQRLREQGFLESTAIRQLWAQHLCRWRNHSNILWPILMFQTWSLNLEQ